MASGDKEHKMLFDIRGRRKNAVKVVYAVLALLMGTSLFLTVGPFSISELFNGSGSVGSAAQPYEEQAERLEAKLKKDPENSDLLASLTRAHVSAGNSLVEIKPGSAPTITPEALQEYQQASDSWTKYVDAAKEPSPSIAQLVAPMYAALTEISGSVNEVENNINAAADAQRFIAEQRPNLNSYSTLALYTYFTGDYATAEEARKEAEKLAKTKFERDQLDTQLDEAKKRAEGLRKQIKKVEAENKAATGANGGKPETLENPAGPLGSSSLGE
jgi:tetratricopeptide (TPR) repeat protein